MPKISPFTRASALPTPTSNGDWFLAVGSSTHNGTHDARSSLIVLTKPLQSQRAENGDVEDESKAARAEADEVLLRACISGGEAAFAALYDRFSAPMFSMVFASLKHQKDAEDVVQESFVQMWKKAATYDPQRGSVFTWSIMIARNKAIDRLRARQRRYKLSEAFALEVEAVPPVAPPRADDLLSRRDEGQRVRAALSRIAPTQVDAIKLAFFGGLTQSEIAERLGAPLGTIKARIRRGLLALRAELATV